jgi:hypothetical protein
MSCSWSDRGSLGAGVMAEGAREGPEGERESPALRGSARACSRRTAIAGRSRSSGCIAGVIGVRGRWEREQREESKSLRPSQLLFTFSFPSSPSLPLFQHHTVRWDSSTSSALAPADTTLTSRYREPTSSIPCPVTSSPLSCPPLDRLLLHMLSFCTR